MKTSALFLSLVMIFLLAGCSSQPVAAVPSLTAPQPSQTLPAASPTLAPVTASPSATALPPTLVPASATPDPNLAILMQRALAELKAKLNVNPDDIQQIRAAAVNWPDTSLGCPQPGMMYAQMVTPGYLILLGYGGKTYEYHADGLDTLVTCDNPGQPIPPQ